MAGPYFPVQVNMTEAEAARLATEGEARIRINARTPRGSVHSTHNGGQINDADKSVRGSVNDAALRFQD